MSEQPSAISDQQSALSDQPLTTSHQPLATSSPRYRVYLAVPGPRICWGTVIGVVNCTARHEVHPYNGGMGFSGVEDFNMLWADAHNLYERGEITHFAMLHGDITPDASQRWLDILLEEMEARGAALVSAVSPIKDHRGVTSSGICDLSDPWRPYKRFTLREIHERLPETFSNVTAGYPGKPLLHNTGIWVCDLRRPEFRAENARGELDLYFAFPTRAIRGTDGQWQHQRESEDWLFSRELWARGVKDTYITRRVKLIHHGNMDFSNAAPWGTFTDGDDNTADKWRAAEEAKPLALVQMLEFELGDQCNLACEHAACPNRARQERSAVSGQRSARQLDDDTIVRSAVTAYRDLGFTGLVGWIYYNEPLLEAEPMFRLMARIKAEANAARFILWTNGTLVPEECDQYRQFEQIIISGYNAESRRGCDRLLAKGIQPRYIEKPDLDDRLELDAADPSDTRPCLRPFVEIVFDSHGDTHLCCYDWRGEGTWGNLLDEPIEVLAERWRAQRLPAIAGQAMTDAAPAVCRACEHRWDKYQQHDARIVQRARRWREAISPQRSAISSAV